MSNIVAMVKAARESSPNAFMNAFTTEMNSRIADQISVRRTQVVGQMFNVQESEDSDEPSEDDLARLESMSDSELEELVESLGKSVRRGAAIGAAAGAALGGGIAHATHGQHVAGAYAGAVGGAVYGAAAGAAVHGARKLTAAAKAALARRKVAKQAAANKARTQ